MFFFFWAGSRCEPLSLSSSEPATPPQPGLIPCVRGIQTNSSRSAAYEGAGAWNRILVLVTADHTTTPNISQLQSPGVAEMTFLKHVHDFFGKVQLGDDAKHISQKIFQSGEPG